MADTRSVWNGTLTMGLVSVQVALSPCLGEGSAQLHRIVERDGAWHRVKRIDVGPDGALASDAVSAYDTGDGWVTITPDERISLQGENMKQIALGAFVPLASVDPFLYEKPYWVKPQRGSERHYALLVAAMQKAKLAGVGSYMMRSSEHPVVVYPRHGVLVVDHLYFSEEIREAPGLDLPAVAGGEVAAAVKVLQELSIPEYQPMRRSPYAERLLALIEQKRAAGEVVYLAGECPKTPGPTPPDIMEAFRAELERKKTADAEAAKPKRRAKAKVEAILRQPAEA